MEKHSRKPNRLQGFDYGQTGCYFVTLCTHRRQPLFQMENPASGDRPCAAANQLLHMWVTETQNKFQEISIDKYVIMPDHLHLLVTIQERHAGRSLQDVMWFFKTMTTNAYIRAVKQGLLPPYHEKLWQKSYYDHVIRSQQDYNETWEYIENNPAKWILLHSVD